MYIILCTLMYFLQEKMIFHPDKLANDFKFEFKQNFKEWNIKTKDEEKLELYYHRGYEVSRGEGLDPIEIHSFYGTMKMLRFS